MTESVLQLVSKNVQLSCDLYLWHQHRMGPEHPCLHLQQLQQRLPKIVPKKCLQLCMDCKEARDDLQICLTCLHAYCGPAHRNHCSSHASSTKRHECSLSPESRHVICQLCCFYLPIVECHLKQNQKKKLRNLSWQEPSSVDQKPVSNGHDGKRKAKVDHNSCNQHGRGIQNIGNTCYLAALMQCIAVSRPLHEHFASPSFLAHYPVHREFRRLAQLLVSKTERPPIHPGQFLDVIANNHRRFRGKQQQDSHELLRCLMSSLDEEYVDECRQNQKSSWRNWSQDMIKTFLLNSVPDLDVQALDDLPFDLGALLRDHPFEPFLELLSEYQRCALQQSIDDLHRGCSEFASLMQSQSQPAISLVDEIFGGELHSEITCLRCDQITEIIEPYYDLSLPINPHYQDRNSKARKRTQVVAPKSVYIALDVQDDGDVVVSLRHLNLENEDKRYIQSCFNMTMSSLAGECSLSDCLKAFFTTEVLDGPDAYDCQQCGRYSICSKKYTIRKAPPILVLHLKRFHSEGSRFRKENKHVQFPLQLCLDEYTSCPRDADLNYSLSAFVIHQGGLKKGHYTSCRRQTEDQPEWIYLNDSHCSPTSKQSVLRQQAYILIYQRR